MFQSKFKIQINVDTRHAHIGFRITDNYVQNYVVNLDDAAKLFNPTTREVSFNCGSGIWWYKKLKNHHKNLLKRGIKHQEFKKFEYKYNKRAYELMLGMNIPINIIFNILALDLKIRKKHIINNYPNRVEFMTDEDLSPFNLKQKAFKKSKKNKKTKKPYIIFTPMGNKR